MSQRVEFVALSDFRVWVIRVGGKKGIYSTINVKANVLDSNENILVKVTSSNEERNTNGVTEY